MKGYFLTVLQNQLKLSPVCTRALLCDICSFIWIFFQMQYVNTSSFLRINISVIFVLKSGLQFILVCLSASLTNTDLVPIKTPKIYQTFLALIF